MIVSFARVELRVAHSRSLKDKRRVVRSIVDKVRARFGVRVAEVGGQDTWQAAELGFALVGTDRVFLEALLERIVRFIESESDGELVDEHKDSLYYGSDAQFAAADLEAEEQQASERSSREEGT